MTPTAAPVMRICTATPRTMGRSQNTDASPTTTIWTRTDRPAAAVPGATATSRTCRPRTAITTPTPHSPASSPSRRSGNGQTAEKASYHRVSRSDPAGDRVLRLHPERLHRDALRSRETSGRRHDRRLLQLPPQGDAAGCAGLV